VVGRSCERWPQRAGIGGEWCGGGNRNEGGDGGRLGIDTDGGRW